MKGEKKRRYLWSAITIRNGIEEGIKARNPCYLLSKTT